LRGLKEVAMSIITWVFIMLIVGFTLGLVVGLIILCIDRRRKKTTRILSVKDGITLEYNCSPRGIYETIRAFIEDK
jgi:hypothetical protein